MRIALSLRKILGLALPFALAALLVAADAEAGKKKNKKKKKDTAPVAATQNPAPQVGLESPAASVELARRHLLAYETDAAQRALDELPNDDAWGAVARGWVFQQRGDLDAAVAESRRAAELAPRNPEPLLRLGESLTYAEKGGAQAAYAGAEERARTLLDANAEDVRALVYLAVAQQRQKRFDEAATTLDKARELAPDDAMVRYHLGVTHFYQQRWQHAFDGLTAALDQTPGIALAYYYRGLAAGKLDRKDILFNDLDRFVRIAPTAPEANYARQLLASFG